LRPGKTFLSHSPHIHILPRRPSGRFFSKPLPSPTLAFKDALRFPYESGGFARPYNSGFAEAVPLMRALRMWLVGGIGPAITPTPPTSAPRVMQVLPPGPGLHEAGFLLICHFLSWRADCAFVFGMADLGRCSLRGVPHWWLCLSFRGYRGCPPGSFFLCNPHAVVTEPRLNIDLSNLIRRPSPELFCKAQIYGGLPQISLL